MGSELKNDYEAITGSGRPFARKLENGVSDKLRLRLDQYRRGDSSMEKDSGFISVYPGNRKRLKNKSSKKFLKK